eukprot:CAMPEP_0172464560 /NCGR_PEP_ID=MMETSP1065-20121228/50813_1 /TAXON_ID=265537 /ORGANISM="Amphiprora paludosa, Strain CCMP125" /LENGTH=31 /DNA_ID= /DNA_START= /DNA_END= /DNA_ORIENTATION=
MTQRHMSELELSRLAEALRGGVDGWTFTRWT